jgi:hypothetical protein
MIKVRIEVLVPTCLLTAAIMVGCGGGKDPAVQRAAERCVAEAQNVPAQSRSAYEAACAKTQAYCADKAQRNEKLCEAWLQRFK